MKKDSLSVKIVERIKNAGVTDIRAKVTNKFNYVAHVRFSIDQEGRLTDWGCDGYYRECEEGFCIHCAAVKDTFGADIETVAVDPSYKDSVLSESVSDIESEPDVDDTANEASFQSLVSDLAVDMDNSEPEEDIELPSFSQTDDMPGYSYTEEETDDKSGMWEEQESAKPDHEEDSVESVYDPEEFDEEEKDENDFDEDMSPREMSILLGTDTDNGEEVYLYPNNTEFVLHNNIGIIGTMGTGKTQFTKSLVTQFHLNDKDNYDGMPIGMLIFDYKGDYNETKPDFSETVGAMIVKPYKIPYNPFALNLKKVNIPLLPLHTANNFMETVSKIYNLGAKQMNILLECIIAAYKLRGIDPENEKTWRRPAPTFEDVFHVYENSPEGNVKDSLSAVMNKLHNFRIFESDVNKTVSLSQMLKNIVVMDISGYDEDIQGLVVAITLDQFYSQMQTFGSSRTNGKLRQLRTLILVDEADNFMKMGFPSLRKIMKEGREFGVGVILSTQSLTHFSGSDDDYSRYILTWIVHNVNDLKHKDIEFVLKQKSKSSETEKMYLAIKGLKKHRSVVKISDNQPLMIQDKPFWELYNELHKKAKD